MNADLNCGGSIVISYRQLTEIWQEIHMSVPDGVGLVESVRQMRMEIERLREIEKLRLQGDEDE